MTQSPQIQSPQNSYQNLDRSRLVYDINVIVVAQQLPAAATSLFTVPQNVTYIIKNFAFFNTDSNHHTVTLRFVPPATPANNIASDAFTYWEEDCIPRGSYYYPNEQVLTPGYQIVAFTDTANLVNMVMNGALVVSQ